ncbi:3-oxoacyl-[acyl-carrier-protein] synthase 3 [Massilia sp. Bi118]|uniref:ketoacyl-ACP synthase III n=1 Tax=Massilia sp. Bi118 TaxID=2822346 RepID=UPI001D8248CE|nr:ketoacyl-ACP synthase III [Massilia sp. Bi118]CAH0136381.1 3-oxoacyl-[acyl-carrier-protein] synthase 3 [Massilia sp. Bi118]
MAQATIRNVRYAGMATCVPKRVVSNIDDCPPQIRPARERLVRNIGIETRRVCSEWQYFSDLAYDATERLLDELKWERDEIDALIVVTQSPDYPIPSTAIIMQDRLGLKQTTIAFDINLGCSAYAFGLHVLGSMISAGGIKKGLLLVGDKSGSVLDPLFSDAGTATALEYDPDAPPMYFDLNSDGSGYQAIMLPVGGHREPYGIQHLVPVKDEDGIYRSPSNLVLDGPAVLSFSTQRIPPAVRDLLEYAGCSTEQVDYFIFHQANRMINETIRKKLGLPPEKVPSTLHDFGNTSGASLPVTMTARIRDSLLEGKKKVLLSGFGIGLSWGSCIIDIESAVFPEMIIS